MNIKYKKRKDGLFIVINSPLFTFEAETPHDFVTDFGTGIKLLGIKVTDERWIPCALLHDLLRGLRSDGLIIINGQKKLCPWWLGIALPYAIAPKKWQRYPVLAAIVAWELIRPIKLYFKSWK